MIPAPFDYARPTSLDEALGLVAGADPSIRVLAGGQSLIPLMKLRLARPQRLVDVGRLDDLRGVRDLPGGGLSIGALTTWATLLADPRVTAHGALADALPMIGDVQVRNRGTIGGSLAHADPASDIAAPILALEAALVARSSARGERVIEARDLFAGPFATSLQPDEILTEIRLLPAAQRESSAYVALPQLASGYPIAGVAIRLRGAPSGAIDTCTIGVTGVGEMPYRAFDIERVAEGQRVGSDIHADREYRAAMAVVMARRAYTLGSRRLGAP